MSDLHSLPLDAALQQAVVHHKAGRLAEAERLYRTILQAHPRNADANHHFGVLAAQMGKAMLGLPHLKIALESDPAESRHWLAYAAALFTIGRTQDAKAILEQARQQGFSGPAFDGLMAQARGIPDTDALYAAASQHHQAGRMTEAIDLYTRVVVLDPGNVGAHVNLGNALIAQKRAREAAASYERTLVLQPDNAEVHNNLGNALEQQGKLDEAAASYERAIDINPDYADAHYNLGIVLGRQDKLGEAETSYRRALAIKPDFAKARYNLGSVLCLSDHTEEGFAAITRSAELTYGSQAAPRGNEPIAPHKARHDREQRDYLAGGIAPDDAPAIDKLFHLEGGRRLATPAVNPNNVTDIAEQWRTNRPQIVVIDNLLTDEALDELRRFCWGSTVWQKDYDEGYLGAMAEYGFACPLLAQIADELRGTFPTIFRAHPLRYLWAFKYDSRLAGINIHADDAAVNVNFWITPDEANLNPQNGGLVVWDVAAPLDWNFAEYNGDVAASRDFLVRSGARPVTVPYRANRAVIFDSDLFHETDKIEFKNGYLNRRINITLLYGRRAPGEK